MSSVSFRVTALAVVAAAACAHNPYRGRPAGEPLSVVPVTDTVPITRDTVLTDAAGVTIGHESTVIGHKEVIADFAFKQGDEFIDEQDFYHLAEDQDGFDAVERARARAMRRNRIGIAVMLASTAAAIAVPVTFGRSTAPYAVGQWFVAFPIGLGLAIFGQRPFREQVLGAPRAFQALGQDPPGWVGELGH